MNPPALLLVLTLCALSCVPEVRTQDKALTLRLCGRELLRAVVYTCGGSRWRRLAEMTDFARTAPSLMDSSRRSVDPDRGLRKRDVNQYLTIMCCQIGCRKSDLSRLC